jgi:hypothetical protein
MTIWLALTASALAGCDARTLGDAVTRAESAFVEMDEGAFVTASSDARVTVDCLADVLTPVQVAGFHRVNALQAFLRGDHGRATLDFRAVLGTQPGYQLPQEIAPAGHPLRRDFEASAQYAEGEPFALPTPSSGWLLVDGQRSTRAPGGRPFLLQWVNEDGLVSLSAWVDVGAIVPKYPTAAASVDSTTTRDKGGGKAVTWIGVGTLVVGGGLYGGAFVARNSYEEAVLAGDEARINRTHSTTNLLAGTGAALLAGGAVLTIVGAF